MTTFRILPQLILRTPLFSYTAYEATVGDALLQNPFFQAALYFASPSFYRLLAVKNFEPGKLNEKELFSLGKYYNRMSFRPTPFGMFSSFSLASWGDGKRIIVSHPDQVKVSVQADQELSILAGRLLNSEFSNGAYFINPTLYRLGPEFRFIQSVLMDNSPKLEFTLESLQINSLTKKLVAKLKKGPADAEAITGFLQAETGCSGPTAADYLDFLKDSQVIMSSMWPNITGTDYLSRIKTALASNYRVNDHFTNTLPGKRQKFYLGLVQSAETYTASLKQALAAVHHQTPEKLFYVNSERPVVGGSLDKALQISILDAVNALAGLSLPAGVPLLDEFVKDFKSRFGDRKISLLQALDPDAGIGYGNLAEVSGDATLLNDIPFRNTDNPPTGLPWSAIHQLLLKKWNALKPHDETIVLHKSELEAKQNPVAPVLPPSISVLFRMAEGKVYIESAGGATGTSLIGRFTPFSKHIAALSREVAESEKKSNPGVIFAEVAQLSNHHVDNVNRRLNPYDYEIPVNSISLMEGPQQISLADLAVSVKNDELVLESTRLKKRVIPRLSSAFNYRHNNLAIFRFLCDLQFQSVHAALSFDLENYFPGMDHYPRVEFGGTILALAKWHLKKEDLQELTIADHAEQMAAVTQLREKFRLPSIIALTNFDQQLVFNLENERQVSFFSACVSGMHEITLREFPLPHPSSSHVVTPEGKPQVSQFIAFLVNDHTVFQPAVTKVKRCNSNARDFILGTNWLYFKLYCTPSAANDLLRSRILPVLKELSKEGPLKWFFIRYADPGNHIRLRIKVEEPRVFRVITLLKARFSGLIRNDLVRDYMADTYRREIERYGEDMIDTCEEFFQASSDLVLHFIKNNEKLSMRVDTHLFAISSAGLLLERMLPGVGEQITFLESTANSLLTEFKVDKQQQRELDRAYRKLRPDFTTLAVPETFYQQLKLKNHLDQYMHAAGRICARTRRFTTKRKNQLLADLVHMHLNRVFTDRQRKQEMVLYYCFLKHKLSEHVRAIKSAV